MKKATGCQQNGSEEDEPSPLLASHSTFNSHCGAREMVSKFYWDPVLRSINPATSHLLSGTKTWILSLVKCLESISLLPLDPLTLSSRAALPPPHVSVGVDSPIGLCLKTLTLMFPHHLPCTFPGNARKVFER